MSGRRGRRGLGLASLSQKKLRGQQTVEEASAPITGPSPQWSLRVPTGGRHPPAWAILSPGSCMCSSSPLGTFLSLLLWIYTFQEYMWGSIHLYMCTWAWTPEDHFSCCSLLFETRSPTSLGLAKQAGMADQLPGFVSFQLPQN